MLEINKANAFVLDVVDHIESNIDSDSVIVELSKKMSMSLWHFQRTFKSLLGFTIGDYIRGRRLSISAQQLLENKTNILNVSLNVGFHSHEAYSRAFKKQFGITPTQFIKEPKPLTLISKAKMDLSLYKHILDGIEEPEIRMAPETRLVGIKKVIPSPYIVKRTYCEEIAMCWQTLFAMLPQLTCRTNESFYGICIGDESEYQTEMVTYMAAVAVEPDSTLPKECYEYYLPEHKRAYFKVNVLESDTVNKTIEYVYGYWLFNQPFERAEGVDYEQFTGKNIKDFSDMTSHYSLPLV